MSRPRQGSRRTASRLHSWLPICAIVLGLLATVALGRFVTAAQTWLGQASTPATAQALPAGTDTGRG